MGLGVPPCFLAQSLLQVTVSLREGHPETQAAPPPSLGGTVTVGGSENDPPTTTTTHHRKAQTSGKENSLRGQGRHFDP